ncbi:MAG: hypothetical protein EHM58_06505 [Ignavibacteriae bacterium]|nr:MAG: hypothetical protein EHM58_06505 [Ignavibacteriota bacterium]
MSDLNIIISHRLAREEIIKRINDYAFKAKNEYNWVIKELSIKWNDNIGKIKAHVKDKDITGEITVTDDSIILKGDIPSLSIGFESKIESEIRERLIQLTYDKI